jgi:hypothetical protein
MEPLDQCAGARVEFGIEPLMGVRAARKKAFEAEQVRMVGAADDDRTPGSRPQQKYAAQDEGTHDPLPELRFLHEEIAQPLQRNDQGLDRSFGDTIDECGLAR